MDAPLRNQCLLRLSTSVISRVNRVYSELAAPILYGDLMVTFRGGVDLRDRVLDITEIGLGRQCLKYARRLEVMYTSTPFLLSKKVDALCH